MATKNMDIELKAFDGEVIKDVDKPLTMKMVVVSALLTPEADKKPNGDESAKRYKLAFRLYDGGEQDLKPEELTLIKMLVGQSYTPLVVGQVYEWADA